MDENATRLRIRNLSKTYPAQVALRGVDLDLAPGKVHALLGQNGSGKSTLIKTLAGYHRPDDGAQAWLNGSPFELGSASAAHAAGLRFIHQDLGLVPDLDVIDNLALGGSYEGYLWLSNRAEAAAARTLLEDLGVDLDVNRPLRSLPPAQRTVVAIARALRGGVSANGVLVLDEPTANLPEKEVEILFDVVRTVCAQGTAVLYVTHRLGEVFQIADDVSVLRDGQKVITAPVKQLTHDELVTHIAGRPLTQLYPSPPAPRKEIMMHVDGVSGDVVRDVSFPVHAGEVLGIAGITGSGREGINRLLFGATPMTAGTVSVSGRPLVRTTPQRSIAAGIAYIPADRRSQSALPEMSVRENVTLVRLGKPLGWLGYGNERKDVATWLQRLEVTPPDPDRAFKNLSGGNQQKTVLARWLRRGSKVFLLDEPTQGVDVGGKQAIYEALGDAARAGAAIVMASSDAEELAEVCDRVLVMREGRVAAVLAGDELRADAIATETLREGATS